LKKAIKPTINGSNFETIKTSLNGSNLNGNKPRQSAMVDTGRTDVLQILRDQFAEQNLILSQYLEASQGSNFIKNTEKQAVNGSSKLDKDSVSSVNQNNLSPKEKTILPSSFGDKDFFFSKLPKNQEGQLARLIEDYTQRTPKSKAYATRYKNVLADYRSTLGFRISTKEMVYPIVSATANGCRFVDIDDNEYVDITMGMGSCIFGHQPDFITTAIKEQLDQGINIGPLAKLSGEVASLISEITKMDRVCFANTGSEAVSFALRLARTVTGKKKIVIFSGSYHGHSELILGISGDHPNDIDPMVPGVTKNMVQDLIVLNYTDTNIIEQIKAHANDLAGVLIEPVRSRYPEYQPKELIAQLRKVTTELDVPLIFDEMITGFRIMPGGAQEYFGIKADIATYGKIAGGGMPIGVIAGSAKYLDAVDGGHWEYGDHSYPEANKTLIAGTFTRHPLAMAASKAVLTEIQKIGTKKYEALNEKTERFVARLNTYFKNNSLPIEMVCFGSLFCFKYKANFELLLFHLIQKGIYAWAANNLFLSFAHTDEDIEKIYNAICESVTLVHGKKNDTGIFNKNQLVNSSESLAPSTSKLTLAQKQLSLLHEIDPERSLAYILSYIKNLKEKKSTIV